MSNRIVTVTALLFDKLRADEHGNNVPVAFVKGKFYYLWHDDRLEKYRFLGYCINQYAVRIATLKHDSWIA